MFFLEHINPSPNYNWSIGFKTYLFPVASSMTTPVCMSKTKTGADFLSTFSFVVCGPCCNNLFGLFRTLLAGFAWGLFRSVVVIVIGLLYTTTLWWLSYKSNNNIQFYFKNNTSNSIVFNDFRVVRFEKKMYIYI